MESTACRAARLTGRDNPETLWPTRNATSSGKLRSARVCVTAMTRAELGRKVGRTEVINATPGVNLRLLSITEPSNAEITGSEGVRVECRVRHGRKDEYDSWHRGRKAVAKLIAVLGQITLPTPANR